MPNMTTAYLTATLRELVRDEVRPQFQRDHMMFNEFFSKRGQEVNSRGTYIPIYLSPNQSNAWMAEGGVLPAPGAEIEKRMVVYYTRYAKGFEFTQDFILQSKQGSSIIRGLSPRLARYRTDIMVEFSQLFYGDGTGTKAVTAAAPVAGTVALGALQNDGTGNSFVMATTFAAGRGFMTFGADQLSVGRIVNFHDPASPFAKRQGGAAATASAGDCVVLRIVGAQVFFNFVPTDAVQGDLVVDSGSYGLAFHGLEYHIIKQTGDYQGLSRTGNADPLQNYAQLKAKVYDAGGVPLTFGLMTYIDEIAVYRQDSTDQDNMIVTSPAQYAKANLIGATMKRYTSDEDELRVGFTKIRTAQGGLWKKDRWCPEANVYYIHKPDFIKLELMPLDYVDNANGGNMVLAATTLGGGRRWAYTGWLAWMGEFAGLEPRNQGAVINLELTGTIRSFENS